MNGCWACVCDAGHVCMVLGVHGAGWGGCIASSDHVVVVVVAVLWPCHHCCHCRGAVAVATGITSLSLSLWCGLVLPQLS